MCYLTCMWNEKKTKTTKTNLMDTENISVVARSMGVGLG